MPANMRGKCNLHLPYKTAKELQNPENVAQNFRIIERWANNLVANCLCDCPDETCCSEGTTEQSPFAGGNPFINPVPTNSCSGITVATLDMGEGATWDVLTNIPPGDWILTFPTSAAWMNQTQVDHTDGMGGTLDTHTDDPATFSYTFTIGAPTDDLRMSGADAGIGTFPETGTYSLCPVA